MTEGSIDLFGPDDVLGPRIKKKWRALDWLFHAPPSAIPFGPWEKIGFLFTT